jgi:hypothetical protein
MNTIPTNVVILGIILLVALIVVIAWFIVRRQRQSRHLKQRFGLEYGRAVDELGSRVKAESELKARENRAASLSIKPLAPADAARFTQAWNALQARFIDNPKGVVVAADHLVTELMVKSGYPMGDFAHRAADMSVAHPGEVATYRAAQLIAARDERGEADTEELRKAVVYYRTLFDALLQVTPIEAVVLPAEPLPAHS